jgi:hypothetical protein
MPSVRNNVRTMSVIAKRATAAYSSIVARTSAGRSISRSPGAAPARPRPAPRVAARARGLPRAAASPDPTRPRAPSFPAAGSPRGRPSRRGWACRTRADRGRAGRSSSPHAASPWPGPRIGFVRIQQREPPHPEEEERHAERGEERERDPCFSRAAPSRPRRRTRRRIPVRGPVRSAAAGVPHVLQSAIGFAFHREVTMSGTRASRATARKRRTRDPRVTQGFERDAVTAVTVSSGAVRGAARAASCARRAEFRVSPCESRFRTARRHRRRRARCCRGAW